ncbi:major facilitator superfamily domain-containing protein [Mariannaea sp. PMI_226]|nr:major facilitator superfamily domain-containing protein [Mariannaea sp. PMI_226]
MAPVDDSKIERGEYAAAGHNDPPEIASVSSGKDILGQEDVDPAWNMKMHLVNNAIDEIGYTPYHTKLFFLNGFGYTVDSLILVLQSVIAPQAYIEFGAKGYPAGLTMAVYVGMFLGALFWGVGADVGGRKWAFNISLALCSIFCIVAGAANSFPLLGFFIAGVGFGGGGNLVLDITVFLEYLPSHKQWILTSLALWWGFGQAIAGFIAWGFLTPAKWNCVSVDVCTRDNNMGWRYVMWTSGAIVFIMSILRITVIRLKETPKFLLGEGKDAEVIEVLQSIATKYNRPCSLTLEQLEACGVVKSAHSHSKLSLGEIIVHIRGLFATKMLAFSTGLIWLSWILIGLAYPLFYAFLNTYLASRGANEGVSVSDTWRNYVLTQLSGCFGPILAGFMCNVPWLGRKYTMVIGALLTCLFFFAYTTVHTAAQNVGFSCAVSFCCNIYYGTLYAYSPEVFPTAHRSTGNGIAVAGNRIMGIISAVVATSGNTTTTVPIYICAALFIGIAATSACFPFEPYGRRAS